MQANDADGRACTAGGASVKADVKRNDGGAAVERIHVTDSQNGTYRIEFGPLDTPCEVEVILCVH